MKTTRIALFVIAFAVALFPVASYAQYAQPVCAYPAHWIWRGYWSCEYPARVYYAPTYYYPNYGGYIGRAYPHGGAYHGGGGHSGGGVRSGGGRGGRGGHR
jgi:hypothetical protein